MPTMADNKQLSLRHSGHLLVKREQACTQQAHQKYAARSAQVAIEAHQCAAQRLGTAFFAQLLRLVLTRSIGHARIHAPVSVKAIRGSRKTEAIAGNSSHNMRLSRVRCCSVDLASSWLCSRLTARLLDVLRCATRRRACVGGRSAGRLSLRASPQCTECKRRLHCRSRVTGRKSRETGRGNRRCPLL